MENKIYEKYLNERMKYKYLGKANDMMADFLEELENSVGKSGPIKDFHKIDNDWEKLWDKIIALTKKL